jgi:hypothetical protein
MSGTSTSGAFTDADDPVDELSGPVGDTVRGRVRRWRWAIVVGVLVVVVTLLLALAQSSRVRGLLDPEATDPSGSRALATILAEQGVEVVRVTTTEAMRAAVAEDGPVTLLVAPTAPLSPRMTAAVRSAGADRLVLVAPLPDALDALAPGVRETEPRTDDEEIEPGCRLALAERAGPLPAVGPRYTTERSDAAVCWGGSLVDLRSATVVVGAVGAFTNSELAASGNASMTTSVLGSQPRLVWWLPSFADPAQSADEQVDVSGLIPPWVGWVLAQLVVVVAAVVWWRGRRLGRIVVEPLPVVVRPTETVEGRARLYRRAGARDRAANALRAATLDRMRIRLSLPRGAPPAVVAEAAARRTGRPVPDVVALLAPSTVPPDDAALVALRTALDTLENEVRRS